MVSQPGLFHKQFSADNKFHSVENTEICQAFSFIQIVILHPNKSVDSAASS